MLCEMMKTNTCIWIMIKQTLTTNLLLIFHWCNNNLEPTNYNPVQNSSIWLQLSSLSNSYIQSLFGPCSALRWEIIKYKMAIVNVKCQVWCLFHFCGISSFDAKYLTYFRNNQWSNVEIVVTMYILKKMYYSVR